MIKGDHNLGARKIVIDDCLLRYGAEGIGLRDSGNGHAQNQFFLRQSPVFIGLPDYPRGTATVIDVFAVAPSLVQNQCVGM